MLIILLITSHHHFSVLLKKKLSYVHKCNTATKLVLLPADVEGTGAVGCPTLCGIDCNKVAYEDNMICAKFELKVGKGKSSEHSFILQSQYS